MGWRLLNSDAELKELVDSMSAAEFVAVDTEFMRRNTFYPRPGLIQLCFDIESDTAWLIDPLHINDPAPLARLLTDSSLTKVLHSASEDLEVFQHFPGVQPRPLFDTQKAAAFAGMGFGMGYSALVKELTGVAISKQQTRSDWLARPLQDVQLDYAALDVVPLLQAYRHLSERLHRLQRYDWVLEEGRLAIEAQEEGDESPHLRVKSAWKLNPRKLQVLIHICTWREARARHIDKPRNWILKDALCLALASHCPGSMGELRSIPEMPPALVRKQGEVLLNMVEASQKISEAALPPRLPQPLSPPQRNLLKRLKSTAAGIAEELAIPAEALLPARDYELLVRLLSRESIEQPGRWQGWRKSVLMEPLLDLGYA